MILAILRTVFLSVAIVWTATAADRVRTVPVPDNGEPAVARVDADGTIHLVFNSSSGPQYMKSVDDGKSFSGPIPVVNGHTSNAGLEFAAWDMVVGPKGHVHVAMGSNAWKLKLPKDEWALYYARLDPGAPAFTPLQNVNHVSSEGFSLAADDAGNVTACWLSGKLYANVSHDNGKSFGTNTEIDPALDPCDCCTTSVAFGRDGKLAVLYREETDDNRDIFPAFWDQKRTAARRVGVSTTLWKTSGCPMTYFHLSRTAHGFVAVWPTKGDVYFARLGEDGAILPPGEIKTTATTGMRMGILALADHADNTLIVSRERHTVHWQLYDRQGAPTKVKGSVRSRGKGVAAVVDRRGDFVVFQ